VLARVRDRNIRVVYLTILLLGVSYGLAISIVGVWLEELGFSKEQIGSLAVFFAGGIVSASIPAGWAIKRWSAKGVLVACLVGYAAAAIAFPFASSYLAVGLLRYADGAFSVGVWIASETILLERAPREDKGYFTSLYAIALALGYVIGPLVARLVVGAAGKPPSFIAAGVLSIGTALAAYSLLDGGTVHAPEEAERSASDEAGESSGAASAELGVGALFWRIKMSCLATFAYGYFQASVVLFLPLYLLERGITEEQVILVPAFFAGGMLLFANVAARLGDRLGHLAVMRVLALVGTGAIVGFLFVRHIALVDLAVFVAGASLASVSPVSLALQGLVVPARYLSRAGGLYNACYALGMLVGPPIASALFAKRGGEAMIGHFAVLWLSFVLASLVFRRDDPRAAGGLVRAHAQA